MYQVTRFIPGSFSISIFPFHVQPEEIHFHPPPSLVLIIPETGRSTWTPVLKKIREKIPHTPVVLIAENPGRDDILLAFRLGVKDCLLFPIQENDFLQRIETYCALNRSFFSQFRVDTWIPKIKQWFRVKKSKDPSTAILLPWKESRDLPPENQDFPKKEGLKSHHEIEVRFFGAFSIKIRGKSLPALPGEKINAVMAFLLYHHPKPSHREVLLAQFWGYNPPNQARKSLNVAMHTIRRHLHVWFPETNLLQYSNDAYLIDPAVEVSTDARQFWTHWKKGRSVEFSEGLEKALPHFQKAAVLYQGDFLEDIHYEEWCEQERDNLKETYLLILDRLATFFFQKEAYEGAAQLFLKMLEKDICLEDVHRKLIMSYYRLGKRHKAIRQYYKCTEALQKELNIELSKPTRELFELISAERPVPLLFFS